MWMFYLAVLGVFAGILVFNMLLRWVHAIAIVSAKYWTYGESPRQRHTLIWALPIVLVLHSGPWAIVVTTLIALNMPHSLEWKLFFGGFVLGIALVGYIIL